MTQLPAPVSSLCLGRDDVTGDTLSLFSHNKREEKRVAANCTAAAAAGAVFAQIVFCEMQTEHRRARRRGGGEVGHTDAAALQRCRLRLHVSAGFHWPQSREEGGKEEDALKTGELCWLC